MFCCHAWDMSANVFISAIKRIIIIMPNGAIVYRIERNT